MAHFPSKIIASNFHIIPIYNLLIHKVFHCNLQSLLWNSIYEMQFILSVPFLALLLASLVLQVQTRIKLSISILKENAYGGESPSEFYFKLSRLSTYHNQRSQIEEVASIFDKDSQRKFKIYADAYQCLVFID